VPHNAILRSGVDEYISDGFALVCKRSSSRRVPEEPRACSRHLSAQWAFRRGPSAFYGHIRPLRLRHRIKSSAKSYNIRNYVIFVPILYALTSVCCLLHVARAPFRQSAENSTAIFAEFRAAKVPGNYVDIVAVINVNYCGILALMLNIDSCLACFHVLAAAARSASRSGRRRTLRIISRSPAARPGSSPIRRRQSRSVSATERRLPGAGVPIVPTNNHQCDEF
jgi:hypothetical protein